MPQLLSKTWKLTGRPGSPGGPGSPASPGSPYVMTKKQRMNLSPDVLAASSVPTWGLFSMPIIQPQKIRAGLLPYLYQYILLRAISGPTGTFPRYCSFYYKEIYKEESMKEGAYKDKTHLFSMLILTQKSRTHLSLRCVWPSHIHSSNYRGM